MSDLARANGWTGFQGLAERVTGGWEHRCDGMPSFFGCPESVVVRRPWSTVGRKRNGWVVVYGEGDDGIDVDVVLAFCPRCYDVGVRSKAET